MQEPQEPVLPQPAPAWVVAEDDLRAFVGSGADYFIRKWQNLLSGKAGGGGFNFGAFLSTFLLGPFYLAYRKLWGAMFAVYGVMFVYAFIARGFLKWYESNAGSPHPFILFVIGSIAGFVIGLVIGLYVNRWYFHRTVAKIRRVRASGMDDKLTHQELKRRGGTNWVAALFFFLIYIQIGCR